MVTEAVFLTIWVEKIFEKIPFKHEERFFVQELPKNVNWRAFENLFVTHLCLEHIDNYNIEISYSKSNGVKES